MALSLLGQEHMSAVSQSSTPVDLRMMNQPYTRELRCAKRCEGRTEAYRVQNELVDHAMHE